MCKLLRGMRLPSHQWREAMDHAVMLHNLLSSSSLPNNASPHLRWTGKLGNTKMLRVFECMVQYRLHTARVGRYAQRAQWGLHMGIEKHYNAWKIFDIHSKETVAARDVIFYERLTLQTYLDNLAANRDLTGGFHGNLAFASAADKADWDEQNVDNASEEAGPLPYCSVNIPMDDDNPRESVNAETYFDFTDTAYVTPQPSEGFGFESQCVHFGHPSAGGCQRSTGDPRLILGEGYRLVVLGGYGRTDPLLNKPFYPNGHRRAPRGAQRAEQGVALPPGRRDEQKTAPARRPLRPARRPLQPARRPLRPARRPLQPACRPLAAHSLPPCSPLAALWQPTRRPFAACAARLLPAPLAALAVRRPALLCALLCWSRATLLCPLWLLSVYSPSLPHSTPCTCSGLHLPSFSTNLVSTAALQDAMVTTTTPGGQRVSICTCTRTGCHMATFTRRPRSSLYTLTTDPPQVAASAKVSASGPVEAPLSCRLLSHQTLLWHYRLGPPSLPRLRGMHSRLLVYGLPRSLPPLPSSPALPCLPCDKGRQRAAPHS
ncbi:unnamed protein product [Closterium sp. NIES-54]